MKKILKHGGVRVDLIRVLRADCPKCGCKFNFTEDELILLPEIVRYCVICPECNSKIIKLCFFDAGFKEIKTRVSVEEIRKNVNEAN